MADLPAIGSIGPDFTLWSTAGVEDYIRANILVDSNDELLAQVKAAA